MLPEADGEVVVHRLVIQEIFLDHVAAVAQAEHKIAEAVVGVELHDVPEDGAAADLDHRLGPEFGFLAQARAQSAAKNHYFHNRIRFHYERGLALAGMKNARVLTKVNAEPDPAPDWRLLIVSLGQRLDSA